MKTKLIILTQIMLLLTIFFTSCSTEIIEEKSDRDYTDFRGQRIGIVTGSLMEGTTLAIGGIPVYYKDTASGVEDMRQGRTSGFMHTLSGLRILTAELNRKGDRVSLRNVEVIPVPKEVYYIGMGGISINQDIIDQFNIFFKELGETGILQEIQDRWLTDKLDVKVPIPDIPNTGINGVLRVAINSDALPFAFSAENNTYSGYSIELMIRFGAYLEKEVDFIDMEFSGLIPYIVSGRADIGFQAIGITEERKRNVIFTDPVWHDQHALIVLSRDSVEKEGFKFSVITTWIKTGIERNLINDNRYIMIIDGLKITMIISLFSQLFGTFFGGFICYLMEKKNKILSCFGKFYCALINGTPMVVLLMITYYVIFGGTRISNVIIAIMAFTLMTGSTVAQILKGAIDTVDEVEIEAARSLGYSAFRAFMKVTLPQAIRRAIPAYTKAFVELVKSTAIVGFIAIQDLTRAGDIIRSRTYDAYFPLLFIALIYLCITTFCVLIFKYLIKKVNIGGIK